MVQHMFRDQRGLAKICRGLLVAQAAWAVFGAVSAWWTYALLGAIDAGTLTSADEAHGDELRGTLVALVSLVLFLGGVIAIGIWIYRASRNAHAIGTLEMESSPAWAVGWYFVPFANLAMPFRAMREIDQGSASALPDGAAGAALLFGGWWAAWLATNITGMISFRIGWEAQTVEGLQASSMLDLISCLLTVAASLLLAAIIRRIQSMQNRAAPTL